LEIQLETLLTQSLIEQAVPGVVIVADVCGQALIDAGPVLFTLPFSLRQRLITEREHLTAANRRE
jgi:hypothetical protein